MEHDEGRGFQAARDFVRRHLPLDVRSGNDLLYGRESDTFVPTPIQVEHCLLDYQVLVNSLEPTGEEPATTLERIMAFEMMEANELVLAFLRHATPHSAVGIDRAGIAASITRSLAIVDRFVPQFMGHDFYNRYARVRDNIQALC